MLDFEETLRASLEDRYVIEGRVGSGGMSIVYRAADLKHNRTVAIKVLRPELSAAVSADRFHREIEVVAGLAHPHILPLHDSGEAGGLLYFVMPLIEGESLRERLEREPRLPIPQAMRITREVAGALGYAHRHGVVHRDVKPGNILLTDDHALLSDFGVARLVESPDGTLTDRGLALGTPAYFSPEQASGQHEIDGRSDLYSVGCLLYEMIEGNPPFSAPTVRGLVTQHLVAEPPRLRDSCPEVPEDLDAIVTRVLQKAPADRFQTAEELVAALDEVTVGGDASRSSAGVYGPRRALPRGWTTAVLAVVVLPLVVLAVVSVRRTLSPPAFTGIYPTYAVLPYEGEELTAAEVGLSRQAARRLYFYLLGWESLAVRGGPSLEGPALRVARAGFSAPTSSLDAGLKLAEQAHASHLVYVEAGVRADSVELVATIYELGDRRPDLQVGAGGASDELDTVAGQLALEILDLDGIGASLEELIRRSPNHLAQQQFEQGREAQRSWRLAEAEGHFRAAIGEDPEFALAHYLLATTLYWLSVRNPMRIPSSGEEIRYHLQRAHQWGDSTRLRPGERRELDAFREYWDGDYARAKVSYDSILARDPANLDALVLAGSVEYEDPWLQRDADGLRPRRNWNRAWALFDSALALTDDEAIAWGRLFDMNRAVAMAVHEQQSCLSLLQPGGPPVRPYEEPDVARVQPFCPIVDGGEIRWVPPAGLEPARARARAELTTLQERLLRRVEFWATSLASPRPHEDLTEWMLWQRSHLDCGDDPATADSLLREALYHASLALEIRGDTTPEDRIRLAQLQAATGQLEQAVHATDRALSELGDWRRGEGAAPPREAFNILLAAGHGEAASEILEQIWNSGSIGVRDPDSPGGKVEFGPVWGTYWALGALGLSGDSVSELTSRFENLERLWGDSTYTPRQRVVLRRFATRGVSPALVRIPSLWGDWFDDWEVHGFEVPAAWRGLLIAAFYPDSARRLLVAAIDSLEAAPRNPDPRLDYFIPIVLAERLGDDSLVAELARRASTCPVRLDNVDLGWGMGDLLERSQEG